MFFQLQGWGPPTLTRGLLESETEPCELSAAFVFAVLVSNMLGFLSLPLCWVFFMFIFHHGSLAELGFWCAWPPPHRVQAKVVSSRLNPSHGTIYVPGVWDFLSSVSPQQKFEATGRPTLQLHVTAQFYLVSKGKHILEAWGQPTRKTRREEKHPCPLLNLGSSL